MKCPECQSRTRTIRTKNITEYLRIKTQVCSNDDCQMTFRVQEEFVAIIEMPKTNDNAHHPK